MAQENYLNFNDLDVSGKKVFLRLDLNVPLKGGSLQDPSRIDKALSTLKSLLNRGGQVVVASHLGRPQGPQDWDKFSLDPVASYLNEKGFDVFLTEPAQAQVPLELFRGLKPRQLILLENLRFFKGEQANCPDLANQWASYTDIYINDAFAVSHRPHASVEALPLRVSRRAFGYLMQQEIQALSQIQKSPPSPFTLIVGGSKLADKLPLVESLSPQVDHLIVGGAMAYTFLKAQGFSVGSSLVETRRLPWAESFLDRMSVLGKKVHLPVDHVVVDTKDTSFLGKTQTLSSSTTAIPTSTVTTVAIPNGKRAMDIGPQTCQMYSQIIENSLSVFWNGPMGVYEREEFAHGSRSVAQALGQSRALSVVGGGDSGAVTLSCGLTDQMDHVSTGGGASLKFLSGEKLPGLEALKVRVPQP